MPTRKTPAPHAKKRKTKKRASHGMRLSVVLWLIPLFMLLGFGFVLGSLALEEMRTSNLQATYFSKLAGEIRFNLQDGPNATLRTPAEGPYNQRLGYSYLPFFFKALEASNFKIAQQMRASPHYDFLLDRTLYPIYRAKTTAGLTIFDRANQPLYNASYPSHIFPDFKAIPPVLLDTLLYIENRELLQPAPETRNPVIEWKRLFSAALARLFKGNAGGGSTLATQIEKFRFSPGGQTGDIKDKVRQIVSASLRVYMDGRDTRLNRERIALDYLNSTPLSARPGFGEINSIGDGLWAWFGRDLDEATIALNLPENDADSLYVKANVYREILGLILAQRRPTYYLLTDRRALDNLIDQTVDRLTSANIISPALNIATKKVSLHFIAEPPSPPQASFLDQKATNALRSYLLTTLNLKNLYELDRLDLTATSTLDKTTEQKVTEFLKKMGQPEFLQSIGLYGFRLLNPENDPAKIKWSIVLFERGDLANRLRLQADNIDEPFDMNEGAKLDLGSTAKLRTLVTYLEIIAELHRRYAGLAVEDLRDMAGEAPDALSTWATTWLASNPEAALEDMLEAAMDRKYAANPGETFFTGGGAHVFANFEKSDNGKIMPVREAIRNSVNLVFIRMMRDIVNYTIAQGPQTKQELLSDPDNPARRAYLERYADNEGSVFLNRYINEYAHLPPAEAFEKLSLTAHKGALARTVLFRTVYPKASLAEYAAYMRRVLKSEIDNARLYKLYEDYPSGRYSLSDSGYVAGVNPLALWLVGYLQVNPHAPRNAILTVSRPLRIESYAWLYSRHQKGAQDTRIRILLEQDAFAHIRQRWARLGYPFERLVPSYATSIGSSADKPGALAELVGILLNDGVKKPTLRFEKLHFAEATPYETILVPAEDKAFQVLDPAVARVARNAMMDVVENGTARRLRGAYIDAEGKTLPIGGKTGTGDHRYSEFAAGGRLISSRVVNRTATLAFFIGDKFYGTVTAHVAGEDAANYKFTSALSAQMLKALAPVLQPLIAPGSEAHLGLMDKKNATQQGVPESPEPGEDSPQDDTIAQ